MVVSESNFQECAVTPATLRITWPWLGYLSSEPPPPTHSVEATSPLIGTRIQSTVCCMPGKHLTHELQSQPPFHILGGGGSAGVGLFILKQGLVNFPGYFKLTLQPRLAMNMWPLCPSLPSSCDCHSFFTYILTQPLLYARLSEAHKNQTQVWLPASTRELTMICNSPKVKLLSIATLCLFTDYKSSISQWTVQW